MAAIENNVTRQLVDAIENGIQMLIPHQDAPVTDAPVTDAPVTDAPVTE